MHRKNEHSAEGDQQLHDISTQKNRLRPSTTSKRAPIRNDQPVPQGWKSEKTEDPKTKRTKLILMFPTVAGEPRSLSIPAGEREERKRIRKQLLDYDARLPGNESDDLALIAQLIDTVPRSPLIEVDKPGFTDTGTGFVLGSVLLGDAKNRYWWRDPSPTTLGAKKGTNARWDKVGTLLVHSSFATLALLAILASPIAKYIELHGSSKRPRGHAVSETATFNFVGPSASGKTLALAVAASATGNPGNRSKWDFTRRGLEEYLESRNEIGAIFDDVEKHIGEQLTLEKAIAIVTQSVPDGQSKEISKIVHAQGLDRKSWSTFALSSSPKPRGDLIKKRSQGHKVRFMDIILPPRSAGGIIDKLPDGEDRVG